VNGLAYILAPAALGIGLAWRLLLAARKQPRLELALPRPAGLVAAARMVH
jgi:hypothetical protein